MSVNEALTLMIAFGTFVLVLIGLVIEIIKNVKK
ncbi:putative holin-like toxin [Lactococcus garvieae]|nr:putative holin-like toxin [Lactococcus garvieae]MCI3861372.1 putative holin-like toxin [Lactococcus garvieae]